MFLLALQNLRRNLRRTILAGTGIALTTTVILVVNGIYIVRPGSTAYDSNTLTVSKKGFTASSLVRGQGMSDDIAEQLLTHKEITRTYPILTTETISSGNIITLHGVTTDFLQYKRSSSVIAKGNSADFVTQPSVILGHTIAQRAHLSIGDTLSLNNQILTIIAILQDDTNSDGLAGYVYLPTLQRITKHEGTINQLIVDTTDVRQATQRITNDFPDLEVSHTQASSSSLISPFIRSVLIMIAALLGCFGIMITFLSSVYERSKEIATMRALGFSSRALVSMLFIECGLLCAMGIVAGCFATFLIMTIGIPALEGRSAFDLTLTVSPFALMIAVSATLAAASLATMYPAIRVNRMNIIQALRSNS